MASRTLPPADLARGIRTGNRATLARAITLIESKRADHRKIAHLLVQELLPHTGSAVRLGITGAPGAGKSTTIDVLGTYLTGKGHKVAVLAVDPSSTRTGGSILGDKTRMAQLAMDANAFVRPSPSSGTLGGVAAKTRETMLVCEAAGYDVRDRSHAPDIGAPSRSIADEMSRVQAKLSAGLETLRDVGNFDYGATEREEVWRDGRVALYRFRPQRQVLARTPKLSA